MKVSRTSYQTILKVLSIIATAGLLTLFYSAYAFSATDDEKAKPRESTSAKSKAASETQKPSPEELVRRGAWRKLMMVAPRPEKGCFKAVYPKTELREIPCTEAPPYPYPPRRGPRPLTVGNGDDISAEAPSGFISTAIGSFHSISNVTSETGKNNNTGPDVANSYSLQINSEFFTSTACAGAAVPSTCQGWEQFIYANDGTSGSAFIQYWLISYNTACPTGWFSYPYPGPTDTSCYRNSAATTTVPSQPVTDFDHISLTGQASATGDGVTLVYGSPPTTVQTAGLNAVNAAAGWQIAEFNVVGNAGGAQANFNAGAELNPRTRIIYGGNVAPICQVAGFTGETNNLSFSTTPPAASQPGPAVLFTENSAGVNPASCAYATTVGDTHLTTFNKLFYDFQAAGDFILAQVGKDFVVQTRQVSGAPTWPNASVNKAVATRMGETAIAVCLAPEGNEIPAQLNIDGNPTALDDGKTLSTPSGVDIVRRGNRYVIMDPKGNSVSATVNTTWINVSVGLGRWPVEVRGLVVNPDGNVNQIAASDGTVLTNPFPFEDLYNHYADSWRVSPTESLLSVCGKRNIEAGIPKEPFYAHHLDPNVFKKARAVCTEAGVKEGPLLDACTLDVAVIDKDEAAKVFIDMPEPVSVGVPITTTPGNTGPGLVVWLLLLLFVVAIILLILLIRRARRHVS